MSALVVNVGNAPLEDDAWGPPAPVLVSAGNRRQDGIALAACELCGAACACAYWCASCGQFVCWRHEPGIEGAAAAPGEHACVSAWRDEDDAAIAAGGAR